jgi:hypothetical protein
MKEFKLEVVLRAALLSGADDKNPENWMELGRRHVLASPGSKQTVMARERRHLDVEPVRGNV